MLPQHLPFVWCEIDAVCFNVSLLSSVKTSAKQVLNEEPDTKSSSYVIAAARTYFSAMYGIQVKKNMVMGNARAGKLAI